MRVVNLDRCLCVYRISVIWGSHSNADEDTNGPSVQGHYFIWHVTYHYVPARSTYQTQLPHQLIPILRITQLSVLYVSPAVAMNDRLTKTEHMPVISNTVQELTIQLLPCTNNIRQAILANNQPDTVFHVFIYFVSLHVSSVTVLIIRRSNCINTSSGMISLCKWLLGMPVFDRHTKQSLTHTNHTRWWINAIRSPDDQHCDARNM